MLNTTLIKQRLLRVLSGRKSYQEVSNKHWILCPSESTFSPPAVYLDRELDKVTAVQEQTSYDIEIDKIRGVRKKHAATVAYLIRNVTIHNGHVYKGAIRHSLVTTKDSLFGWGTTEYISNASLACTWCGNLYFGHWIRDDLSLTLAAQQLADAIVVARKTYSHEPEYRHLFNIQVHTVDRARCEDLIVIDDIGQNKFKRERYNFLRSRLKLLDPPHRKHGVMIRRGTSGTSRILVNEAEIEQFLEDQGFIIIDPKKTSATEIVRKTLGAKIVIGVEGSHLAHGIFSMVDGGTILTLQPPYRFNNVYKDYTDCMDMRYAFVVGKQVPGGFVVDIEDLGRTLDKIETLTK